MRQQPLAFWNTPQAELLGQLETTPDGLTHDQAQHRLALYGTNLLKPRSRPGKYLLVVTLLVIAFAFIFAFMPVDNAFGFSRVPPSFLLYMGIIVALYILIAEVVKKFFYRRVKF